MARLDFLGSIPTTLALTKISEKDTTAVLYKDENLLWSMFYWHQNCHSNVMMPYRFLLGFVFLSTRSWWGLEMQFHLIVVWFHLKLCTKKRGRLLWPITRKIFLMSVHTATFFTIFACNLVYEYKFHGLIKNCSVNFFKNLMILRLITLMYVSSKFQPHWKKKEGN